MSHWTKSELQQTISEVARRCAVDRNFRSLALRDSAAAIAKVNPKRLPDDICVRFVDNSGREKTVPLPDPVDGCSEELSEASLESVSGGTDGPPPSPPPITISGGWSKLARGGK